MEQDREEIEKFLNPTGATKKELHEWYEWKVKNCYADDPENNSLKLWLQLRTTQQRVVKLDKENAMLRENWDNATKQIQSDCKIFANKILSLQSKNQKYAEAIRDNCESDHGSETYCQFCGQMWKSSPPYHKSDCIVLLAQNEGKGKQ